MRIIRGTKASETLSAGYIRSPFTIFGEEGNDTIYGSGFDDFLYGQGGKDAIFGYRGDDLIEGGADADTIDGGDDVDTASYESSDAGVKVDLTVGAGGGGHAEGDVLSNIENLKGSGFADVLIGNADANVLEGGAGGDALDGRDGIDTASYEGSDAGVKVSLVSGRGRGGHAEGDKLSNVENLTGSGFADTLIGNAEANVLDGGEGADALDGGDGADTASYAHSSDHVKVSLATGDANGGDADGDTLKNIENLTGSAFGDYLGGDAGDNVLDGSAGDDFLEGGAGKNTLIGGDGVDTASYAGSSVGVGIDLGYEVMVVDANGDGVFNDADDVTGDGDLDVEDAADTLASIENVIGSSFDDWLNGNDSDNGFTGGDGRDILTGRGGNDVLDGGAGDDDLDGGAQNDELSGGTGLDVLRGRQGDDRLFGGDDVDTLWGGIDADWLEGGAGGDDLDGGDGRDTASYATSNAGVFVDLENETATGGHALNDTLTSIENVAGSLHGDVLLGTNGDNKIEGGDGDDVIQGRDGADELWGGAGNDTFVFDESDDYGPAIIDWNIEAIADFTAGGTEDVIDLTNAGTGYDSLDDILANSEVITGENGATGLMIDLGPSGAVLLVGVDASQLTQSDFVFA